MGAEVAKAVGCKVEEVDKELILGLILQSSNISIEDKARVKLRGKRFLEDMVGRQKWSVYSREKPLYNYMRYLDIYNLMIY